MTTAACRYAGIEPDRITESRTPENPNLTENEKKKLLSAYACADVFRDIIWYPGAKRIMRLNRIGAEVHINSNSRTAEIAYLKREQLKDYFGICDECLHLNVISPEGSYQKKHTDGTFLFVDDSPYNIRTSEAHHNFVLDCPWNTSETGVAAIANTPHERFHSLNRLIDRAEQLLLEN